MKPNLDEIRHANDFLPDVKSLIYRPDVKKYYFEPHTDYYGSHRVAVLKSGGFAVENGGGAGWFKVSTWNEAVSLQHTLRSRWVMLTKAWGY